MRNLLQSLQSIDIMGVGERMRERKGKGKGERESERERVSERVRERGWLGGREIWCREGKYEMV